MRAPSLLSGLFLMSLALPAGADALLEKARGVSKDGPAYLFDMAFDDGDQAFTFKIDQTRPETERVVAITPAPEGLAGEAAKRVERLKKQTKGDIWCASFADSIPANAQRLSETASAATYSFTPLPGEDKQMRDMVKYLTGKATIDKASGQILAFEMRAPKAFKPAAVAKVDQFSLKVACKPAPDGRSHVDTFALQVSGTAMMQAFSQNETRKVSNLRAALASGFGTP